MQRMPDAGVCNPGMVFPLARRRSDVLDCYSRLTKQADSGLKEKQRKSKIGACIRMARCDKL
jgi:hypothetical protein